MPPKVAIIVLNWNNKADTIECIKSLKGVRYPDFEAMVVDNGSTDGSEAAIREAFPGLCVIQTGANLGFARGNNVGIRDAMARGLDYVLLLNNDTVVDPDFLSEMIKAAESDPSIGIVGPRICYFDEPRRIWFAGGTVNYWTGRLEHVGFNDMDGEKYSRASDTQLVTGCAMLIKREVLEKVGMLYEPMFLYFEDSDLCARASRAGYRLAYAPSARILHKVSRTASKLEGVQSYYNIRNWLLFMRRNARPRHLMVFLPYYLIRYMGYNTMVDALQLKLSGARLYLKATYDGLTMKARG
jgi:GT2 family glycosyltransferase